MIGLYFNYKKRGRFKDTSKEERAKELSIEKFCEFTNARWCKDPDKIEAILIGGSALPEQIVLASYNAG